MDSLIASLGQTTVFLLRGATGAHGGEDRKREMFRGGKVSRMTYF